MFNEQMYYNYKKSLEQKYNAVCLDIDGTLTSKDSKNIDERSLNMISKLLKKKVPIIFITGRGETGLKDLTIDILEKLINNYNINLDEFSNVYALINDGARLFSYDKENKIVFGKNQYISSKESFDELLELKKELEKKYKVLCSIDEKNNLVTNVRVVLSGKNDKNILNKQLEELLKKYNKLNLTKGFYKGNEVYQIGTTKKSNAIEITEKIIGIPENSMLRIGDCGNVDGNDFSMLDCTQGFSVDKTSNSIDKCFPVINDENQVLNGVDATIFLINKAKIIPTVCLEKADKEIYIKQFANVEKQIIYGRKKLLKEFDEVVNNKFDLINGIDDLFDRDTGAIKIPMYEWELIDDNNELKKLFAELNENNLIYSLRDNDSFLLRGSKTYYYLLSQRNNYINKGKEEDYTSSETIKQWMINYIDFAYKSVQAILNSELDDIVSQKMILSILDNIRNYSLISLNYEIKNLTEKTLFINLENKENNNINNKYNLLVKVDKMIRDICLEESYALTKKDVITILKNSVKIMVDDFDLFNVNELEKDYSKDFRAYREIDNFIHNYINSVLSIEKSGDDFKDSLFCGLCYGGLELPIIFKILNPNNENIGILNFSKNVSGYSKKQSSELRTFNIKDCGGIKLIDIDKSKKVILMDDNLLTGKTIQLASGVMCDLGMDVEKISIVRYPSINRIDQMFLPHHGAVNLNQFFDYIVGLTFPSPYSFRDLNSENIYEDSLGVFDLNRKKIIECLYKNGDYSKTSEVANYVLKKTKRRDSN